MTQEKHKFVNMDQNLLLWEENAMWTCLVGLIGVGE